jgi:protein polybromo-1
MKIQNNQYVTLDDMENDLLLMISNAKKYNDPKSQIYKVRRKFLLLFWNVLYYRMHLH